MKEELNCQCPNCNETNYSSSQPDWSVKDMGKYYQTVTCTGCDYKFSVSY